MFLLLMFILKIRSTLNNHTRQNKNHKKKSNYQLQDDECDENCQYCDKDSGKCTKCKYGYGVNFDNFKCEPCLDKDCFDCSYNYLKCISCSTEGYGIDKESSKCLPCLIPNCKSCDSDYSKCYSCKPTYGFKIVSNEDGYQKICEKC